MEYNNSKIEHDISSNGDQVWYRGGKRHRDDGPAVIHASGTQSWYRNGKRHRDDGPAVIYANGDQIWYREGKLNHEDGPAVIEANGTRYWYRDDKLHREDGPAVIMSNGIQYWYVNDNNITSQAKKWFEETGINVDNMDEQDELCWAIFLSSINTLDWGEDEIRYSR
jgi:hypothetical protein